MLKIRDTQMEILKEPLLERYIDRTETYIKEEFDDFYKQEENIRNWIYSCYQQAKSFGMNTEREHIKYLNYKCIFGSDFIQRYEFAEKILQSKKTENSKLSDLKYAFLEHLRSKY